MNESPRSRQPEPLEPTQKALDLLIVGVEDHDERLGEAEDLWAQCRGFELWIEQATSDGQLPANHFDHYRGQISYVSARLAYAEGDVNQAIEHYLAASERSEQAGDIKRLALCHKDLAICYEFTGLQAESSRRIFEALKLADRLQDEHLRGKVLYGLASLYLAQGAFEQAMAYCHQTLTAAVSVEDPLLEMSARGGIGVCLGHLGQPEEGIHWVEAGLAICRQRRARQAETWMNGLLIYLLRETSRLDEAMDVAERNLEALRHIPAQNAAAIYVNVADLYAEMGNPDRALEVLKQAEDATGDGPFTGHLVRCNQVAARALAATGDFEAAYEASQAAAKLQTEVGGAEAQSRLVAVERYYATELLTKSDEIHRLKTIELVQKNESLQALSDEKERVLRVVAHDLQNPLAAIAHFSEILSDDRGDPASPATEHPEDSILRITSEMRETIAALVQTTADSVGDRTVFDVAEIVRGVVQQSKPSAEHRNISIVETLPSIEVTGNRTFVRRIVDNLLANSIKYSPRDTTVSVSLSKRGTTAHIEISDQGLGLTAEELASVLTGAAQVRSGGSQSDASHGLGLYIARSLAGQLGGTVELVSAGAGRGATATVSLPLDMAADDAQ